MTQKLKKINSTRNLTENYHYFSCHNEFKNTLSHINAQFDFDEYPDIDLKYKMLKRMACKLKISSSKV